MAEAEPLEQLRQRLAAHNLNRDNVASSGSNFIRPPKPIVIQSGNNAHNWEIWIQQYQWFETATEMNRKPQNVQIATFMSSIGTDAVIIFNTFGCSDEELANVDLIKQRFRAYFAPKTNITYERYLLNLMAQEEGESFDEYLTKIKSQSAKCGFETLHDSLLKDKIIIGIRSEAVREQLLAEDDLSLDKVIQKCRASEQASKQLRSLRNETASAAVHAVKNTRTHSSTEDTFNCGRCGRTHGPRACPAFQKRCNNCDREGHFAERCKVGKNSNSGGSRQKQKYRPKKVNVIDETSEEEDEFFINTVSKERAASNRDDKSHWVEEIEILGIKVNVKLDSGAECNVLPISIAEKIGKSITECSKRLITYTGHKFAAAGQFLANTKVRGKCYNIKYIIVNEKTEPVLGLSSCQATGLIKRVDSVTVNQEVFDGLGCLKNYEYDIDFVDNPSFEIHAARRIPHAYRQTVKNELDEMVKQKVIREVTEATPAVSPMVVVKQHGKIRICIDPTDVNKNVLRRHYPLQTLEEIAAKIAGATVFTKLDCKKGFWQIKLSERTQKYLTFATPWGRYSCIKLPFGLCSAPEIFQQIMTKLLTGIEKAEASMDDILIYANDKTDLNKTTEAVIRRINDAGLTLNKDKCVFGAEKIKFLGHVLSASGVEIDPEKVEVIEKLREPENKPELQRLLGMVTYLAKFIPNLSEITQPLRQLLEKDAEWIWTPQQSQSVLRLKRALSSPPVLRFYNVNENVKLQCDASSYALGATLLQAEQPVAYASRSLTKAERRYPQIEKEALAISFACKKYHEYIYGKKVYVETDHKPLESIFKKPIATAPPRLQRILLNISPYSPAVTYRKGETMYIADTLSRDCNNDETETEGNEFEVISMISISSQAANRLRKSTEDDVEMTLLLQHVVNGWPNDQKDLPSILKPYWNFRDEVSEYEGLLYKGQKVIIPRAEIQNTLEQVHKGHQGIQRSLSAARNNVFWLGMSNDIVDYVERCSTCQKTQRSNIKEPLMLKEIPNFPFEIVATDLFTYGSREFLLLVDSYSGFFDFRQLRQTSSREVIEHLKSWFATHGIPLKLESDNGPQYASQEFRRFAKEWCFDHVTSSPYYPKSNGLAERFVQTAKNLLRKCEIDNTDVKLALLTYRNTPRNNCLDSPSQRLMSRTTRSLIPTHVNNFKPRIVDNVHEELKDLRNKQKQYHDRNVRPAKELSVGDKIRLKKNSHEWVGATIASPANQPRSFVVHTDNGQILRRNTTHIHATQANFDLIPDVAVCTPSTTTQKVNNSELATETLAKNVTPKHSVVKSTAPENPNPVEFQPTVHNNEGREINERQITRSGREVRKVVRMNL